MGLFSNGEEPRTAFEVLKSLGGPGPFPGGTVPVILPGQYFCDFGFMKVFSVLQGGETMKQLHRLRITLLFLITLLSTMTARC